jgi:hypothetical protein
LLSLLHAESSAVSVIKEAKAARFLWAYQEGDTKEEIVKQLKPILVNMQKEVTWDLNLEPLEGYTSRQSAKVLAEAIDNVLTS